jgi:hypothetical protein
MTTNTKTNTNTNTNANTFANWTKVEDRVYGLIRTVKTSYRVHEVGLRIDGREGQYRADRLGMLGHVWEAIDGGQGFKTLAEAKKFVTRWVRAARAQGDLNPRL